MTIENLDANKSAQEREEGRRKPLSPFPFPRKHPKRFRVKNLRENRKYVKIVHLMPNVLTSFNIGCGITAILFAINGKPDIAAMLILLAAFFDMIDGKVARFVGAASPFGIQLDSLADVISFGVTPPLLLHSVLYPDQLNRLSLSLVLIYTLSTTQVCPVRFPPVFWRRRFSFVWSFRFRWSIRYCVLRFTCCRSVSPA